MSNSIKNSSINAMFKKARGAALAAVVVGAAMLAGCASNPAQAANQVGGQYVQTAAAPAARPETIYVYAFASDASEVKLDNHGLISKIGSSMSGDSSAQKQAQDAAAAREEVANEIVAKLQSMGLRAVRADVPPPAGQNALVVEGSFNTIDAGNRRRRVLIGLGAGESKVGATVQLVYQPANGAPQLLEQFDAKADSGHMPGVAEMAGAGAAAGHVVSSLAVSGGVHAVGEKKHADVSSDEKRLGDSIAKQIVKVGQEQGWMPAKS
jgi:outer membrane murein-binding lipoprotein Lpp